MDQIKKKLQQDPTLTPSTSAVGLRSRQFIEQDDYHKMEQGTVQFTHDNDMYISSSSTVQHPIRADAILSRKIYKEM